MQLGTRWPVGAPAPAALPRVVMAAVRAVEAELASDAIDATTWRWTLTWLEGKPVVELDDGTRIAYNPAEDTATIAQSPADGDAPGL